MNRQDLDRYEDEKGTRDPDGAEVERALRGVVGDVATAHDGALDVITRLDVHDRAEGRERLYAALAQEMNRHARSLVQIDELPKGERPRCRGGSYCSRGANKTASYGDRTIAGCFQHIDNAVATLARQMLADRFGDGAVGPMLLGYHETHEHDVVDRRYPLKYIDTATLWQRLAERVERARSWTRSTADPLIAEFEKRWGSIS